MRECLVYWREISKEEKEEIKTSHNIKVVTYDFIESIYLESLQITTDM